MKKVLVILALLSLPIVGASQNEAPTQTKTLTTSSSDDKVKTLKPQKAVPLRNTKALQLNYKKSNDIISIKAYRKSLHVRVRTKKLC